MKAALGVTDFKELLEKNPVEGLYSVFFDKTLIIRDIIGDSSKFILFARPRRFGKTLTMNMLKYFFDSDEDIFANLNIGNYPKLIKRFHGKIPTISITLKDVVGKTYEEMLRSFFFAISGRGIEANKYKKI